MDPAGSRGFDKERYDASAAIHVLMETGNCKQRAATPLAPPLDAKPTAGRLKRRHTATEILRARSSARTVPSESLRQEMCSVCTRTLKWHVCSRCASVPGQCRRYACALTGQVLRLANSSRGGLYAPPFNRTAGYDRGRLRNVFGKPARLRLISTSDAKLCRRRPLSPSFLVSMMLAIHDSERPVERLLLAIQGDRRVVVVNQ